MQTSTHFSVKNRSTRQLVYSLYCTLHHDYDLLLYIAARVKTIDLNDYSNVQVVMLSPARHMPMIR